MDYPLNDTVNLVECEFSGFGYLVEDFSDHILEEDCYLVDSGT